MARLPINAKMDIPDFKQMQKDHKALVKRVETIEECLSLYDDGSKRSMKLMLSPELQEEFKDLLIRNKE